MHLFETDLPQLVQSPCAANLCTDLLCACRPATAIFADSSSSRCSQDKVSRDILHLSSFYRKLSLNSSSGETSSKPMSIPICKFYRSEQGCKFGNKCRYRHLNLSDSPPSSLTQSKDQNGASVRRQNQSDLEASTFFPSYLQSPRGNGSPVSNQQPSGTDCSAIHFGSDSATANKDGPIVSSQTTGPLEEQFRGLTVNDHHERIAASNPRPIFHQASTKKLCHYFARYGNCCFGSRCRFEHASPFTAPRFQQSRASPADPISEEKVDSCGPSKPQDGKAEEKKGVRGLGSNSRQSCSYPAENTRTGTASEAQLQETAAEDQSAAPKSGNIRGPPVKSDKICQFYLRGWCGRGRRCRFIHARNRPSASTPKDDGGHEDEHENSKEHDKNGKEIPADSPAEQSEITSDAAKTETKETSSKSKPQSAKPSSAHRPRPPYVPQGVKKYRREEVDDVEGSRLRRSEIDVLMKRFPKNKVKVNRDCAEYFQCVIDFNPTDPDWVRTILNVAMCFAFVNFFMKIRSLNYKVMKSV